ncbi:MAG: hypothetical protein ABIJ95_01780, partial [Pseudomonadota bacterium]
MDRIPRFVTVLLALALATLPAPAAADVLYEDVPAYNQSDLPAVCSETAIAMVLGWYDTNGYTTQWKRFVPWGGNLMAENFEGIWALVWAIVDVLGTDVYPPGGDGVGDGMDDTDWDNAQAVLPQMLQAIDPGAAFTLS